MANPHQRDPKYIRPPFLEIALDEDDSKDDTAYVKFVSCLGDCCGCLRTWCPCIFCICVAYPYLQIEQASEGVFERFNRYTKTV